MAARWHIIEGEAGCVYARDNDCAAVIVDALRASATAAMMLDAGAPEILAVGSVEDAFRAKDAWPDALLFGERGGLPPEGFDFGNSPRETAAAAGKRVIFTTTNGSARLLEAWGAPEIYMASTVNGTALARTLAERKCDVVLVPASTAGDPEQDMQEDWVAAAALAMAADVEIGVGAQDFRYWRQLIELDGVLKLFRAAPHARTLDDLGLEDDVTFCARRDVTTALPVATERAELGVVLRNATEG